MYVRIDVYDDEDEKSTHNIGSLNLLDIAVYNAQQFCRFFRLHHICFHKCELN